MIVYKAILIVVMSVTGYGGNSTSSQKFVIMREADEDAMTRCNQIGEMMKDSLIKTGFSPSELRYVCQPVGQYDE